MTRVRRWTTTAVLLLIALACASCNRSSARAVGRLQLEGRAEITEVDGGMREITRSETLRSGEQVKMLDGTATLSLGSGRQLELRKDTVVRLALVEVPAGGTEPRGELVAGDVLVVTAEQPAVVVAGDTEVEVTAGAARVSQGLAVTVGAYEGAAGVRTGGRPASVPALRQVSVPAPGLPSRATPLVFSAGDPWDQRYLGDAIDLGNQLVARSRGFSAQLTANQNGVAFFRQILPRLAGQPFDENLLDATLPAGETLVGAAITLEGTKGEFAERWRSVFSFHQDGAPWGLVALDQQVDRAPLLAAVDAAIGRVPGLTPQPTPAPGAGGGGGGAQVALPAPTTPAPSGGTAGIPPAGGTGTGGTTPAGGTTGPGPTGTTPPTGGGTGTGGNPPTTLPGDNRGAVDLGVPIVDDTLNAVIDTLSGLLRAISPP